MTLPLRFGNRWKRSIKGGDGLMPSSTSQSAVGGFLRHRFWDQHSFVELSSLLLPSPCSMANSTALNWLHLLRRQTMRQRQKATHRSAPSISTENMPSVGFAWRQLGQAALGSKFMIADAGCSGIRGRKYGLSDALWQA